MNYIEIKNVTKYYSKTKALDNVNLQIPAGRIIGLLGKNGAGKSTLMRCILGFLKYEGEIKVLAKQVNKSNRSINKEIAFIPDVSSLDDRLTVQQTINYVAALNDSWNAEKANNLLKKSELPLKRKVGNLSKGMKTKLYLLITLSLDVKILLLDEPTLGLDIVFRKEFFNTILGEFYNQDKTIIISTHQVEEVEQILQEIIFIDNGNIVLYENVEVLKSAYNVVTVPNYRRGDIEQHNPLITTESLGHVSGIIKSDIKLAEATYSRPTLSDLFVAKVGGSNE